MRSCDSDVSMPTADSVAPGASPCGPSSPGAPAACGDEMHVQQPADYSVPGQPPAAALDGIRAAAGPGLEVQPDAAPAGGGGAAVAGLPTDAGVLLDDVDIAEQRRILQDIAVRKQDRVRACLSLPAVWCPQVWHAALLHAVRPGRALHTSERCEEPEGLAQMRAVLMQVRQRLEAGRSQQGRKRGAGAGTAGTKRGKAVPSGQASLSGFLTKQ